MKNPYKQIEFKKFNDLIVHLDDKVCALFACDQNGDMFWPNDSIYKNKIQEVTTEIHQELLNSYNKIEEINFHLINDENVLYHTVIYDQADKPCGGLSILVNKQADVSKEDPGVIQSLCFIKTCVEEERKLVAELNSMAFELEERYEELNLVYDTDDQSDGIINGPDVFEQLVQNCTDYLDVAMAVLIMPREDLVIFHHNTNHPIHYVHSLLKQLENKLYPWVEQNKEALVMNDLSDELRTKILPEVPYKLVCCPVMLSSNQVGGILVVLNPNYLRDFTNSDRNLLDAMARKAAKVAMANYDSLTGLLKRNGFEYLLENALSNSQSEGATYCVLHIDLDGVKVINETADTKAGDQLISDVGKLIREQIRDTDSIARLTGDKYGVLLDACSLEMGCTIADNIRTAVHEMNFCWNGQTHETSTCIGVVEMNADCENIQSILAASELAANVAKEQGRNLVQVYQHGDTHLQRRSGEVYWVRSIQNALNHNGFEIYSQMIQPIDGVSETLHFELLIRLIEKDGTRIPPGKFMPAAERFRLMPAVDQWVIENSFKLLVEAGSQSYINEYIWTINLSGQSLNEESIVSDISTLAMKYQISPEIICFEITETAAVHNLKIAKQIISELKKIGFQFALDDFGSGLSSFAYLKSLPVDYLKIDGAFIKGIIEDPFTKAIVMAINQVSQVRGLKTIAEFVENPQITQCIKEIGVNYAQGYGVGKPIPLAEQLHKLKIEDQRAAG